MRIQNRLIVLSAWLLAGSAGWLNASGARVLTSMDYFSVDKFDDVFEEEANFLDSNFGGGSSEIDKRPGLGARVGYMIPISQSQRINLGISVGYVSGPRVDATSYSGPALIPESHIKTEGEAHCIRILLEGAKNFQINKRLGFRFGVGAGMARGRLERRTAYSTGWSLTRSKSSSYSTSNLTWEISPALIWNFEKSAISLGLRYAHFPDIENVEIATGGGIQRRKVRWSPLGAFLGFEF